ncbi:MAG: anthranilate synthase component I [Rhodothalassiaceae bacterium]|nr:MAG: anthranilate synthase component I [Rhodothalassiaceae bacterium]
MADEDRGRLARDLAAGRTVVITRRLPGDLETPVSAYLKLADRPWSVLLESVEGGRVRGRYSIIGFAPDRLFRIARQRAELAAVSPGGGIGPWLGLDEEPLAALRRFVADARFPLAHEMPPMLGAVIGYLGYDMVRAIERLGAPPPDPHGVPTALFMRPTRMAVFDAVKDEILLAAIIRPDGGTAPGELLAAARADLDEMAAALARSVPPRARWTAVPEDAPAGEVSAATAPERYMAMVERAKEHILAGDIFQVVLAQRFSRPFRLPAFALYRALRRLNPAPFLFFLRFGDFALAGSSPEILVRVKAGEVTIRPIAGTRPRGEDPDEDARLAAELLADPKERAEHLMLLDLGRNDVGRVAVPGTVRVAESFVIERYSHVMHIVSEVRGRLDAARADVIDALMAGFPAGTVSGAPKVRAMQIIDELEAEGRGPYAGAVGYFAPGGDMDSCIVLRTALVKDGLMHVHAGAGIVADSVPEREQAECENKARALIRAAEIAEAAARSAGSD